MVPRRDPSGIELDGQLPADLHVGGDAALVPLQAPAAGDDAQCPRFHFLHEAPAESLSPYLEREHPQTIAVVVSHLPAGRAAQVLAALGTDLQLEVARRLVDLNETDPEILREVERGLESWICREVRGDGGRTAGMAALLNILEKADPLTKENILAHLGGESRQALTKAEPCEPAAPPPAFADLERLDERPLGVVLAHAAPELLLLALAGASQGFAERAIALFPAAEGARCGGAGESWPDAVERRRRRATGIGRAGRPIGATRRHWPGGPAAFERGGVSDPAERSETIRQATAMPRVIKTSSSARAAGCQPFELRDLGRDGADSRERAQTTASDIVAAAQAEAAEIKRRAEEAGLAAARAAADRTADERLSQEIASLVPALREAAKAIHAAKAAWLAHWQQAAIGVATAIAERVIRREVAHAPEITLTLVTEALELAAGSSQITLRLHPDDLATLGPRVCELAAELARAGAPEIVADAHIERGGCRLDTRFGSIDQQSAAQLARIADELT